MARWRAGRPACGEAKRNCHQKYDGWAFVFH
jgi:hypothetical protein